ncbi:MAG: hypothetical protein OJF51_004245 [Nitrospira sp.]|nr:MAG: hypothetical protein OJF51_004245 [Nitrospira sp.]
MVVHLRGLLREDYNANATRSHKRIPVSNLHCHREPCDLMDRVRMVIG